MENFSKIILKKILPIIIIALTVKSSNAQWVSNSRNDEMWSLAINGSNIFAGGYNSMYLSTDNGTSWTTLSTPFYDVFGLAISGSNIYAGSDNGSGVYLSTDNGSTWTPMNNGLPKSLNIHSLAIGDSGIFAATGSGVSVSTNNGGNWMTENTGLTGTDIHSFGVSGFDIFAATEDGGVCLSTNNGNSWIPMNTGLTNTFVTSVAISGSNVFAGTQNGVFLSTNNGNTWAQASTGIISTFSNPYDTVVNSIAISGSNIFAGTGGGVFLSTDNGGTWKFLGLADTTVFSIAINGTTVFVGTSYGVFQQSLSSITGIQQIQTPLQTQFMLYPNPANSSFIVETTTTGEQLVQIFDVTGKLMLTRIIKDNKTTIDASSLASGIYTARLVSNDGVANEKLVITK